jgi:two-component system, OmpR family, sensor histidine kinase BaeS
VTGRRPLSPLGMRLTLAFLAVAMAAVAVFAALIVVASRSEASGLSIQSRRHDLSATAAAAADAYVRAGGWDGADLFSVATVAAGGQATLAVLDADGVLIAAPTDELAAMMARMHGLAAVGVQRSDPVSQAVIVDGRTVGTVMLRFPTETMDAERHVRDALSRAALTGTLVAGAVALVVAVYVSVRVTRPVTALTSAAGDLAAGRRDTRVDLTDAPGELHSLADAFNEMADNLDREDQLRRNLLADVAHELRTPLTILQGNTEALLDGIDEPTAAAIGSLHDEVVRLGRLVADLETLAAAEAAGLRLHTVQVDLADVVRATVDLLGPLAAERNITIDIVCDRAQTNADPDRLQQIVVNLFTNAVKFTAPGGRITIATETANDRVILRIADTGPGLADDEIPHLFERFWRGHAATKAPGSGIGLAVVAELVAAHHGTLDAANRAEGGAEFTITLPSVRQAAQAGGPA